MTPTATATTPSKAGKRGGGKGKGTKNGGNEVKVKNTTTKATPKKRKVADVEDELMDDEENAGDSSMSVKEEIDE